jgi:ketosteroid isomerase-like protein
MEAIDFQDLGDTVLVSERQRGTGKRSGLEMEQTNYAIWKFRDGLVTHVRWEIEREAAERAAGIAD